MRVFAVFGYLLLGLLFSASVTIRYSRADVPQSVGSQTVAIPPINSTIHSSLSFNASGNGSHFIGAVNISNDVGTIELNGKTLNAYAYIQAQPMGAFNELQGIAVDESNIYIYFFNCKGNQLTSIWLENAYTSEEFYEWTTGTCIANNAPVAASVKFPMLSMKMPSVVNEWKITGPNLSLNPGQPGFYRDSTGNTYDFYPFLTVDCSQCGTSSQSDGWYELHSLFVNQASQQLCYGEVYLELTGIVHVGWSVCLPDLSIGTLDNATTAGVGSTYSGPLPQATLSVQEFSSLSNTAGAIAAGSSVSVIFTIPAPGDAAEWIGLFPYGAPDAFDLFSTAGNPWQFLNGIQIMPLVAEESGGLTFSLQSSGNYEFRLYSDATHTRIATSLPFTVTP